jgi:hypothetical protein
VGHQRRCRRMGDPPSLDASRGPSSPPTSAGGLQMNRPTGSDAPAHYELRVAGHLGEHWSIWFAGMTLTREDDGTTTLRGLVVDQAALHGLLARVRDVGAPLISVRATDPPRSTSPAGSCSTPRASSSTTRGSAAACSDR